MGEELRRKSDLEGHGRPTRAGARGADPRRSLGAWQAGRRNTETVRHRGKVHLSSLGFQRAEDCATRFRKSLIKTVRNSFGKMLKGGITYLENLCGWNTLFI